LPKPTFMRWDQRPTPNTADSPGAFTHKLLAEGDSWFTLGGVPQWNLLRSISTLPFNSGIVSMADPGDQIRSMADIYDKNKNPELRKALSKRFGYAWDVILLSGGGNDLVDYAKDLLRPIAEERPIEEYVREDRLQEVLSYVQLAYRKIALLREAPGSDNAGTPIVTHTYDYATPRNASALIGPVKVSGPWLFPAFVAAGIPETKWQAVSDLLLNRLGEAMLDLQNGSDPIPDFHVVDTRATLTRALPGATGNSNDWLNEIHPNQGGYDKLAVAFAGEILAQLQR
jgi:hypothetical protein